MASVRSLVRGDENAQVGFHSKTGAQGRTNGPAKGLKFKEGLQTPRRALGDVGNIFKTPGNVPEKSTMLKSNQQHILKSSKQKIKSTPLGSHKQKSSVKTVRKDVFGERDFSSGKEKMIPFVDDDKPLPRSDAVKTILQNVHHLYRGCMQPSSYKKPLFIDNDQKCNLENLDTAQERQNTSDALSWLPEIDDSFLEVSKLQTGLDDLDLPPIDTDLSGLGLP